ncbi:serine/threonine-protein kinase [Cumulibacter manganitolerans]|uniref:serine/threonine-protein kinase n=1 Tax=Cumulibacter manganitolerans TaxID=1884992 RepID=UPI0012962976|nr:serine/threonine-protein kinase [Cumulibacter manganitolerans]
MEDELIAGRYRIGRPIGRGGMGTVWLCRDEVLDRDVAIKQIGSLPGEDADGAARARREARLAASLNHPNAVAIYDVIEHHGQPWLVMEYLHAKNLSQLIKEHGTLAPEQIAPLAAQVAKALAAAHRLGIVHRDVKPSNILVDRFGVAKITDFGIAKGSTDPQLTRTGLMAGTPAYFAPELARGRTPSPASDVWALGATIFHALEGRPPFGLDENTIATLYRIGAEEPARPTRAGILAPALSHLLDTDAERRWSMAMAADKLSELADPRANLSVSDARVAPPVPFQPPPPYAGPVAGAPSGVALPAAPWPPAEPPTRKRGALIAAVVAAVALVGALVVALVVARGGSTDAVTAADGSSRPRTTAPASAPETSRDDRPSDQFSNAPVPSSAPPSTAPSSTATSSPTATPSADPNAEKAAMEAAVAQYYALLPHDPKTAYQQYLTGGLKGDYGKYAAYWSSVNSVACDGYAADVAAGTVWMHCVYDEADQYVEEDQIATVVKIGDAYYLSAMAVPQETRVVTPK